MRGWLDRLSPGQRDSLRDAGRIGNSRFATEGEYARHIANPELTLLVHQHVGVNQYGDPVVVLLLPASQPRRWYTGELITWSGRRTVAAVNEHGSYYSALTDATNRSHTITNEEVLP